MFNSFSLICHHEFIDFQPFFFNTFEASTIAETYPDSPMGPMAPMAHIAPMAPMTHSTSNRHVPQAINSPTRSNGDIPQTMDTSRQVMDTFHKQ